MHLLGHAYLKEYSKKRRKGGVLRSILFNENGLGNTCLIVSILEQFCLTYYFGLSESSGRKSGAPALHVRREEKSQHSSLFTTLLQDHLPQPECNPVPDPEVQFAH